MSRRLFIPIDISSGTLVSRFWKKTTVRGPNDCWPFNGELRSYGSIFYDQIKNQIRASRVSYAIHYKDPEELFVCHTCDNPGCVNPAHLWLGTNKDNMRDCANKQRTVFQQSPGKKPFGKRNGRHTHPESTARGVKVNTAKLTPDKVLALRRDSERGRSSYELAKLYGVTASVVRKIVRRIYWSHV